MESARVSSWERCVGGIRECSLQVLNFVDLFIGGCLAGIGIYLRIELGVGFFVDVHTSWLALSSVIMGGLLILSCLLSFCSITNTGCRCLIYPSGYIALIVAILALSVGSAALGLKPKVFRYLDNDGTDSGITASDVNMIKAWYQIIAYGMFGLFLLQVLRFRASMRYRSTALRIDGEFSALLAEDDKNWNEKLQTNKTTRAEKYDDLRAHYKAKYANNATSTSTKPKQTV